MDTNHTNTDTERSAADASDIGLRRAAPIALLMAALAAGCANMNDAQRGTATGAGIGAVAGAVLSRATGGSAGTGAVIGGALGAVGGNVWSKRQEERRMAMEQATRGTGVEVSRTADNQLKLNVPNDVSFDVNSATLRPELRQVLTSFATSLRDDPVSSLSFVGHTDSTGSDSTNDPLSVARARSVRDFLVDRGVGSNRISVAGRGEREPVADNGTDAGRARNRRVEMYVREQG